MKTKSQGKLKTVIPSGGGLGNEIKNKINKKLIDKSQNEQNKSNFVDSESNSKNNKTNKFRYTRSDLVDAEMELNVSNIIQLQSEITDDILLYNKEDQFLNSAFNKNNINVDDEYFNGVQSFNNTNANSVRNFCNNLDSEEILDDKWDDIKQFISLKDIALLSMTNKKIGKNAILEIIQELEK